MQIISGQDDFAYDGPPDWPTVIGPSGSEVVANYTDFANSGSVTAVIHVDGAQVGAEDHRGRVSCRNSRGEFHQDIAEKVAFLLPGDRETFPERFPCLEVKSGEREVEGADGVVNGKEHPARGGCGGGGGAPEVGRGAVRRAAAGGFPREITPRRQVRTVETLTHNYSYAHFTSDYTSHHRGGECPPARALPVAWRSDEPMCLDDVPDQDSDVDVVLEKSDVGSAPDKVVEHPKRRL